MTATADGRRRIEMPDDWVRTEIAMALEDREKSVVPVLLDGARPFESDVDR